MRKVTLFSITSLVVLSALVGTALLASSQPSSYDDPQPVFDTDAHPEFTPTYEIEDELSVIKGAETTYMNRVLVVEDETVEYRAKTNIFDFDEVITSYANTSANWTTTRVVTDESRAGSFHPPEGAIVRNETDGDHHIIDISHSENRSVAEEYDEFSSDYGAGLALKYTDYEHRDEETYAGRTVAVYEPKDGWYEPHPATLLTESYRILDSEGEIYVDQDTGTLLYADVSFTFVDASNYAEYVYHRTVGDEVFEFEMSLEFFDDGEVDRPEWAEKIE